MFRKATAKQTPRQGHRGLAYWIDSENTYNLSIGGNVCILFGENNGFYGKKHSEELINKLSNFYSIEGKEYRGAKLVAQEYNITTGTVKNRCKSNTEKWKDWILIKKRD